MLEKQFVTRTEWKKHIHSPWITTHGLWPHIKKYGPAFTYSEAEIDAFFEGEDSGKKQVHWDRVTNKPETYPPSAHTLASHSSKAHSELTGITANQHHAQSHTLVSHTARDHHHLVGLADDDHTQYHNNARGDARYYTKTQLQTSGQSQVHWDNITNKLSKYPPDDHYHVGTDIITMVFWEHFDGLNTGNIDGQGDYGMAGTWTTTASADCSAQVVVKSGADKMLRLTDNNGAGSVSTKLSFFDDHEMVVGAMKFNARVSALGKKSYIGLYKSGTRFAVIRFYDDNKIYIVDSWANSTYLQDYEDGEWYKIKIHADSTTGKASVFIDNVYKGLITMDYQAAYYADEIRIQTDPVSTGYTFDIDDLFIMNLTI